MLGVAMFPLRRAPGESSIKGLYKAPHGWQTTTPGAYSCDQLSAAPAVAAVGGAVLDFLDIEHDGMDSLAELAAADEVPPVQYVVRTAGGGLHLYVPPLGLPNRVRVMPGVDIRTTGGFVLVPPTPGYEVVPRGDWPELGAQPGDAVERLRARFHSDHHAVAECDMEAETTDAERDKASAVLAKAVRELRDAPEGTRNDTLNRWAFVLYGFAAAECLDPDTVTGELAEAARRAGLGGEEIARTLASAERSAKPSRPLTHSPEDDFDALDDPAAHRSSRSPWADGGTFLFDQPEQVPTIWGDVNAGEVLWAEGEALMLAGPPGVGKTTLTGQLVRALLFGGDVLGWPVASASGRVLYLAMDRPRQIARALRRHFDPGERAELTDRLSVWQGPPPGDMAKDAGLLAQLASQAGASHVIVDSLKDAALGLTEEMGAAGYNRARQTALADGVQVVELHHMVKRGPNGKAPTTLADLYGGMPITAGAGSVLLLWGEAGQQRISLRHLKPILEPVPPSDIVHDHLAGISHRIVVTATDATDQLWRAQVMQRVWDWLDSQNLPDGDPGPSIGAVERGVGGKADRVRTALDALVEGGYVERTSRGQGRHHRVLKPYVPEFEDAGRGSNDQESAGSSHV